MPQTRKSSQGFEFPWDESEFIRIQQPEIPIDRRNNYGIDAIDLMRDDVDFSQLLNADLDLNGPLSTKPRNPDNSYPIFPSATLDSPQQITDFTGSFSSASLPSETSICPLITGQASSCRPERCGPNAACLNLPNLPEIEECHTAPCLESNKPISNPDTSPEIQSVEVEEAASEEQTTPLSKPSKRQRLQRSAPSVPGEDENASRVRAAKQAHSAVEKRYRENLNGKIMQLHQTLLGTDISMRNLENGSQMCDSEKFLQSKVRKSDILTEAMNYVHQTEVEMRHMSDEIRRLNDRIKALEKLVKCEDCTLLKQMVRLGLQQSARTDSAMGRLPN